MPLERLAVTLELITFPGLSAKAKRPNLKFKELVIRSLQKKEQSQALVDGDKAKDSQCATTLSQFLSSICTEITHQCSYSTPYQVPRYGKPGQTGMVRIHKLTHGYRRDTHHTLSLQSKLEISIKEAVEFSPRTQSGGQPKWVDRWIASNVLVSVHEYGMEEFMPDQ
ncbi:uncharacterized protein CIMG_10123 [Coccidioides immitis RS]|uniref:Uncharacterized protein n=1 Tax=Coccidioides immitis (strain RS) TaxID=246410 RepID=J3K0V2_COCIM|nr:uncharacterized protein CIMG_10123 [Coccidioides immitis RS]EAS27518.3 hypothetical protein CIMG_10123 [Coccidioides immitis RS]TPX20289.1 hypothetical protein DIZ76_016177 [Coccidioides immitis]